MKLAAFSRYSRMGASSRLRTMQYAIPFKEEGISLEACSLFDDDYLERLYSGRSRYGATFRAYVRRLRDLVRMTDAAVVWVEKEMLPWIPAPLETVFWPRRVPVVSDYDDALFHRYDLHPRAMVRGLLGRKIDRVMSASRLVTAGNRYLADRAREAGARWVEIVPTVVDTNRYFAAENKERSAPPVIGWIGTPGTWRDYMVPMLPLLTDLAERFGAEIWAIGAGEANDLSPRVRVLPWREESEIDLIGEMDIGIMPLSDTPWSRGKCGYKLIQYMACGLPVVASPVGVNAEIVEQGVNGLLATSEGEWRDALEHLLMDSGLRQRMGSEGRRKVEAHYSLQVWAPRLAEMLHCVAAGKGCVAAGKGS